MDPAALMRNIARLSYAAVRLPFTVLDERVVAPRWGEGAPVRQGLELSLGSLDRFAGWLLADEQISRRGQALLRRTGHPVEAAAPGTQALARPARDKPTMPARPAGIRPAGIRPAGGQDKDMDGKKAADQQREDKSKVASAANEQVTAGSATAGHAPAGGRAAGQPGRPAGSAAGAGTADVRFTLPAEVQAGTVALCGEFNNWSAHDIRLERGGDGSWQATVALQRGRSYRYRYLLDGKRWENAWHADRYVPNPYGGTDSVVIVG